MKKTPFSLVQSSYPSRVSTPKDLLYASIGYPELSAKMEWDNTCAVRVSLALLGAGVNVPGHMTIKAGRFKGRTFQPGQAKLSAFLARSDNLGAPEKFNSSVEALIGVRGRRGIISFIGLHGPSDQQGHIDIVSPDHYGDPGCGNSCYWGAREVWFWPMK